MNELAKKFRVDEIYFKIHPLSLFLATNIHFGFDWSCKTYRNVGSVGKNVGSGRFFKESYEISEIIVFTSIFKNFSHRNLLDNNREMIYLSCSNFYN